MVEYGVMCRMSEHGGQGSVYRGRAWRERATVADVVVTTVGRCVGACVRVVVVFRGRVFRA